MEVLGAKDQREDIRKAYQRIAKNLQDKEQQSKETSQNILQKRLKTFQKELDKLIAPSPLLVARTILIKKIAGFPPTLEGIEKFKEPRLMNTDEFQARLAIDIISYGIHSQRTNGKLWSIEPFIAAFIQERSWWETTPKTLHNVLHTLINEGVVTKTNKDVLLFEPIELSQEIRQVINLAKTNGVLSIEETCSQLEWVPEKAQFVLKQLEKDGIAVWDMIEQLYYFPVLKL